MLGSPCTGLSFSVCALASVTTSQPCAFVSVFCVPVLSLCVSFSLFLYPPLWASLCLCLPVLLGFLFLSPTFSLSFPHLFLSLPLFHFFFPFLCLPDKGKGPKAPGDSSASSKEPAGSWIIAWDCLPGTWYGLMGATKKSWLCYWLLEDLLITEASFALISIPGQPKGNRSSLNLRSPQRENDLGIFKGNGGEEDQCRNNKVVEAESDKARSRDQIKQSLVNSDLFWWARKTVECFDQRTAMMSHALMRDQRRGYS